jgi:hypothetical protein
MATKLNSLIIRETDVIVDDRPVHIALTEDQRVSMRLKGMKSGVVTIPIVDLYAQLTGSPVTAKPKSVTTKRVENNGSENLISIARLRSLNHVTPSDPAVRHRLEDLLTEFEEELSKQIDYKNSKPC